MESVPKLQKMTSIAARVAANLIAERRLKCIDQKFWYRNLDESVGSDSTSRTASTAISASKARKDLFLNSFFIGLTRYAPHATRAIEWSLVSLASISN